jgi:predicted dinucleotide-binding enzyme
MMKIAILGAGKIGSTLGKKWAAAGHPVAFGVRNVDDPGRQDLLSSVGKNVSVNTAVEAIASAELILFAVPGQAVNTILTENFQELAGKIIIDATNKVVSAVMNSTAEIQNAASGALIYRAFNSLGWENFEDPIFNGIQADLFYCGPEGAGQAAVEQLIAEVGLRPVRLGGLEQAELVDSIARLWFALALGQGKGRHLAFKVLTR